MREGVAHLLGVSPSREFVEHKYRDMAEITGGEPYVPAQVDSVAASAAFVRVEARAREVALRAQRAHAVFGLAAAAADREAWPEAARGFVLYFKLADEAAAAGEPFEPPLLGTAYARFHAGMAEYQMRHAPPALEHLQVPLHGPLLCRATLTGAAASPRRPPPAVPPLRVGRATSTRWPRSRRSTSTPPTASVARRTPTTTASCRGSASGS